MANNPPPYNRSIFGDALLTNPGNSPFPDTDTHNLFATGFNPPQQLMLNPNGLNQMASPAHDINSLLSNQQNTQAYNPLTPKPSIGNGPIAQPPIPIHGSIFSQPPLPPLLNLNNFPPNPNQIPSYHPSAIGQVSTQIIQPMQPMMQHPQYMNSPYMMDMLRRNMQTNNGLENNPQAPVLQPNMNKQQMNPMMRFLMQQRQKPAPPSHSRKRNMPSRKGFVSEDNDSDMGDDAIASSDEGGFSGSSDATDFENYPDNWVPDDIDGQKRSSRRENIKGVQHDEDVVYYNEDEEESSGEVEQVPTQEPKFEHIYMSRITPEGIEYLVRFQDSPPALCNWISEAVINVIPNAKPHLDRFNNHPTIIDEDVPETSKDITPISHRRETPDARPELLFRYFKGGTMLFYWDFAKEEVVKDYFDHQIKIYATHPTIPSMLPEADENIVVSKSDTINLRPLQLYGVNWLIQCWKNHHGSILADEKGLGKTVQVLGFLSYLTKYTDWRGPFLIIVRNKSFDKWCSAIENWTDLKYVPYISGPAQRSIMREHQFEALDDCGESIPETFGFNIFLVTYDVFMSDLDFLQKTNWQVVIADEGHRLKNKNGKKNIAISSLNALHRIIITGSPIQNTLGEFWTLLRFVSPNQFQDSPDFLFKDIKDLTKTQIYTLCERIKEHVLRRLLQDERSIPPRDEKIAFVSLTPVQRDLIRLAKLDQLWRLKGTQNSDEEIPDAELKICSHPFLIPNAEKYYTEKVKMRRPDLLLFVSAKFQWLEHILPILKHQGNRVLIFCQNTELHKILNEFCASHFWTTELLIDSMSDSDKKSAITRFATDPNKFIFLISTKEGFDSINLPIPHTAIIFDSDWDPHTNLQTQTIYTSSQTNRVDVYRLITFQTYEHKAFVLSQKKLGLWLILLGNQTPDEFNQSNTGIIPLKIPPTIANVPIDENQSLDRMLDSISTVVRDFSLDSLESLRDPLGIQINTNNGISDTEFLEQFPVHQENGLRHLNRSRTRDPLLDIESSKKIYDLMLKFGYGEWNRIAAELPEHSSEQIRRFGISLCIFAFRAMKPSNITYLPVLVKTVLAEEPDFEFNKLLCSNKHQWASQVFSDEHDYSLEVDSCKKLKDKLHENAFSFLSVIEMRLIARIWTQRFPSKPFDINSITPPVQDNDEEKLNNIMQFRFFDPFDIRVQAIIDKMRFDLIRSQVSEEVAQTYQWWTRIEFDAVMSVLKNFKYDPHNMVDFHAKTTILSKRTEQIIIFVSRLMNMLEDRTKGSLVIPKDMHLMKEAPKTLQTAKGFTAWINILVRECDDLAYRTELINLILKKIDELPDSEPPVEGWGDYHTKKFLRLLIQYGIDSLTDLLRDKRFEFKNFLTPSDIEFLTGKKKRRVASTSKLPDFVFNEDELYAFVRGDLDPFIKEHIDDGYQINDDSENPTITLEDYQLSSDDDVTGVSHKNIAYQFDDSFTTSDNESPTDEEQDDFRPEDE